jgi:hypothetical protein
MSLFAFVPSSSLPDTLRSTSDDPPLFPDNPSRPMRRLLPERRYASCPSPSFFRVEASETGADLRVG